MECRTRRSIVPEKIRLSWALRPPVSRGYVSSTVIECFFRLGIASADFLANWFSYKNVRLPTNRERGQKKYDLSWRDISVPHLVSKKTELLPGYFTRTIWGDA